MVRKLILSGFMSALLLASVIAYSLPAFAQGPGSTGKSQVEYAFGEIPGKDIIVHVAVMIPPGFDKNDVINQALKYQGAKKIEKSEFSLINTLKWDPTKSGSPNIEITYDGDNEPNHLDGVGSIILEDVMTTWNNVENSNFVFTHGGNTNKECPSLVKECLGVADGENTFGWVKIKQPHTLGITYWKTTVEFGLEVDVALSTNNKISWNTTGANYDVFTVVLHELGHALGLGHSEKRDAVMYSSYQEAVTILYQDDICGVQALFGVQDDECSVITTTESGDVSDIYVTLDRFRNGLKVFLDLEDNQGNPVNTSVEITLYKDGELAGTGSATTGDDGSVTFVKRKASSGCYTISVEKVTGDDPFSGVVHTPGTAEDPPTYPLCI